MTVLPFIDTNGNCRVINLNGLQQETKIWKGLIADLLKNCLKKRPEAVKAAEALLAKPTICHSDDDFNDFLDEHTQIHFGRDHCPTETEDEWSSDLTEIFY